MFKTADNPNENDSCKCGMCLKLHSVSSKFHCKCDKFVSMACSKCGKKLRLSLCNYDINRDYYCVEHCSKHEWQSDFDWPAECGHCGIREKDWLRSEVERLDQLVEDERSDKLELDTIVGQQAEEISRLKKLLNDIIKSWDGRNFSLNGSVWRNSADVGSAADKSIERARAELGLTRKDAPEETPKKDYPGPIYDDGNAVCPKCGRNDCTGVSFGDHGEPMVDCQECGTNAPIYDDRRGAFKKVD